MEEALDSALFDVEPEAPAEPEMIVEEQAEDLSPESVEEPAPELTPEPKPVAEPQRPEQGYVPLSAMMDERDRRKHAEERVRQLEQQQPKQAPSPYDDPEGFAAHQHEVVEQRLTEQRFAFSDRWARKEHGAEAVESAVTWAQDRAHRDPAFAMAYMREADPIDWIVRQHKQDALVAEIGDRSVDDFVKDYLTRNPQLLSQPAPVAATSAPAAVAQPKPAVPPVRVPRSLATQGSGPSDVRDVATGPLAAVDAVFPA